jgi:hypothetical protein
MTLRLTQVRLPFHILYSSFSLRGKAAPANSKRRKMKKSFETGKKKLFDKCGDNLNRITHLQFPLLSLSLLHRGRRRRRQRRGKSQAELKPL